MNPEDIEQILDALHAGRSVSWRYDGDRGCMDSIAFDITRQQFVWTQREVHEATLETRYTRDELRTILLGASHLRRHYFADVL